jgi:hypothetical protein
MNTNQGGGMFSNMASSNTGCSMFGGNTGTNMFGAPGI